MKFLILIFYGFYFTMSFQVFLSATDETKLELEETARIINGATAELGQFPYVVLITYSGRRTCTGSIIHKKWVLTAAHCCFEGRQDEAAVVVGSALRNGTTYPVKEFAINPGFTHIPERANNGVEYVINDIGLLHLKKHIEFNDLVSPVTLPTKKVNYNYNESASVAGWGRVSFFPMKPSTLQYAMVQLLTEDECKKDWPYVTYVHHICTSTSEKKSVCYGDSGGPVVYKGIQVGITCTADTYCAFRKPNLHTKVENYVEWIKQQLSKSNDYI